MSPLDLLRRSGLLPKVAQAEVAFDQLQPGWLVKVGGEWMSLDVKVSNHGFLCRGRSLLLTDENGSPVTYPVCDGETFLTREPAFDA